jgi:glycosyltransferase involved in cell wall biosynthesis
VWFIHEFGKEDQDLHFFLGERLSLSLINRLADRVVVNSKAVAHKYQAYVPARKLHLVYYAVEVASRPPIRPNASEGFRLSLVGTLAAGKRQEDAIRALSILAAKGLDVRLDLIGTERNEYGKVLRALTHDLRVEERIEFVGYTGDPFPYMASSDLVLMCSRNEAFGRVSVEAMKLGKPVIGTRSGGTAELIRDGWNGFLYRAGDAEELARRIEMLYLDRALLDAMGRHAYDWSSATFTQEKYCSGLLEVFHEALQQRKGPQRSDVRVGANAASNRPRSQG